MIYRIIENRYYNEFGKEEVMYYTVQRRRSFFGIKIWRTITEWVGAGMDYFTTSKRFKTYSEALDYVRYYLCKKVRPRWNREVVGEWTCE